LARYVLIYRPADRGRAAFLAGSGRLSSDDLARGRDGLRALGGGTVRELEVTTGLGKADLMRMLDLLEQQGILKVRRGRIRLQTGDFDPATISLEREEQRTAYERTRLDMMRGYAELLECRRRCILKYFGEDPE